MPTRPRPSFALPVALPLALAALLVSPAALAQAAPDEWERVPPPGEAGPERAAPAAPPSQPAPPAPPAEASPSAAEPAAPAPAVPARPVREPPIRFVASIGFDYGFEELLKVTYDDDRKDSLRSNGGIRYAIGATFLPFAEGRLYTQATIGLLYDSVEAKNGSASFLSFPLDVVEYFHAGPVRAGAGVTVALGARTRGDGVAEGFDADFDTSAGLVLTGDWVWRFRGAPRGFLTVGPRLVLQKLKTRGATVDANALGASIGFTF